MASIHSFKDLIVWQRAMQLAQVASQIVDVAPRRATRGVANQLLRAADSVTANIAEGHGRPSRNEYLRYLAIAHASRREVESHLLTLERARGLTGPRLNRALALTDECSRMLTVLRRRLRET